MRCSIVFVCFLICSLPASGKGNDASVLTTLHNLSRSGPGPIKSSTALDACGFCHVSHTAVPEVPLWGHTLSRATYETYQSESLDTIVPQPNGSSRLCLACHDGTVAPGSLTHRKESLPTISSSSPGFLGTDLSGTHPVSMVVDQKSIDENNARSPTLSTLAEMLSDPDGVTLDPDHRVQCTSCHDPHKDLYYGATGIHFWRKPTFSQVCLVCHTF